MARNGSEIISTYQYFNRVTGSSYNNDIIGNIVVHSSGELGSFIDSDSDMENEQALLEKFLYDRINQDISKINSALFIVNILKQCVTVKSKNNSYIK